MSDNSKEQHNLSTFSDFESTSSLHSLSASVVLPPIPSSWSTSTGVPQPTEIQWSHSNSDNESVISERAEGIKTIVTIVFIEIHNNLFYYSLFDYPTKKLF